MTTTHRHSSRRRLDVFNLVLLLVSVASGFGALAIVQEGVTALILVPSVVVATLAATHLTKLEAPRD